jgi:hypothetical protein
MKLYNVPTNSRIKVLGGEALRHFDGSPPGAGPILEGEELNFRTIDGMYSYCTRDNGDVVHLAAWAEVDIVEN